MMDHRQTMFVIDDDPTICRLLLEHLRGTAVNVRTFYDSASAFEALVETPKIDLVLLDVELGAESGFSVCQSLRSDPRTSDVPVIFLTASDRVEDQVRAFEAGGTDYVVKPFHPAVLRARVDAVLRAQRLVEERRRAELERVRLLGELRKKVKALTCLHKVARILEQYEFGARQVLSEIVDVLPTGFETPGLTGVRIKYDSIELSSDGFEPTPLMISMDFRTSDGRQGCVDVALHASAGADRSEVFLEEKKRSIRVVVEMIRSWLDRAQAVEALQNSEQQLRLVTEHASDMLSKHDREGAFQYVSRACRTLLGYQPEALIGRSALEFIHPDEVDRVKAFHAAILNGRTAGALTFRAVKRDGSAIWLDTIGKVVPGTDGIVLFVSRDVTERKIADDARAESEQRLRQHEELLRNVLEHIPMSVCWKDRKLRYLGCNPRFAELLGVNSPANVVGRTDQELMSDSAKAQVAAVSDREVIDAGRPLLNIEQTETDPSGEQRTFLTSKVPLRDAVGSIIGILAIRADITDRKRAEDALRAGEAKLHAITSQLPAIIWTTDRALCLNSITGAILDAFDADPTMLIGQPIDDVLTILAPECAHHAGEVHRRALLGDSDSYLFEHDGREFAVRVEPLVEQGCEISGCLGIAYDISDRRRIEEADRERHSLQTAVEAMEQVLGVVGHELRTPLAGLQVMSEYLISDGQEQDEQTQGFLKSINNEVTRLAQMVNNLLEAARINSGAARWNWGEVDLEEVCRSALETVRRTAPDSDVEYFCSIRPPAIEMQGDADAIHRLILNLLTNAQKNTRFGRIDLLVSEEMDEDGSWIAIEIRDTGDGIPQDVMARLGVPFALNSGVVGARNVTGSGLGLAICRGIAAAHGGAMYFRSERGRGTSVVVRLRADLAAPVMGTTELALFGEVKR